MSNIIKRDTTSLMTDSNFMESLYKFAETMSQSKITVPVHLQKNVGDCMAVCMQAAQWGMNPFSVAQKTHIVNGNLGYEAQLVNAIVVSSGAITGRFKFEFQGDFTETKHGLVRCGAILKGEQEITWGEWIDCGKLKVKNSPLWKQAPKQQASYVAVKFWSRLNTPDVIMGVYTPDELDQVQPTIKDVPRETSSTFQELLTSKEDVPLPGIDGNKEQDIFNNLKEALSNCNTFDELTEFKEIMKNQQLSEEHTQVLRAEFMTKMSENKG